MAEQPPTNDPDQDKAKPPGPWQVLLSVASAAFGVQSSKTRKRDFSKGNPLAFILAGLIFTVLLVLSIVLVVSLVLS
jgi:hypothetical protein